MASTTVVSSVLELQEVSKLLQLMFHRNKNQHRLTKWWKRLSMLKRSVTKLLREIAAKETEAVKTRVCYMAELLLPKCYLAFTNVIADQQFAAMGLVLLANLAKVSRIIGGMAAKAPRLQTQPVHHMRVSTKGDEDLGECVDRSATKHAALSSQPGSEHHCSVALENDGVKLGKGKTRYSSPSGICSPVVGGPASFPKPPVKRRSKANAIDDVFDGLA
ncbi:MAG: hypothetical protein M1830_003394 [Pleopsidium flavum]|nr:MAG: hypothetical protein M1830_003394 [Pleopsidium flavum]